MSTSKEIAGKFVAYHKLPLTLSELMYVQEIVRCITSHFDIANLISSMETVLPITEENIRYPDTPLAESSDGVTITVNLKGLKQNMFSRKTGHIMGLTKLYLRVEHRAGFSTSAKSQLYREQGLYDLEHCDVELYEVWLSTDARQKFYRCRTVYPYQKYKHFLYDTRLCYEGITRGIAEFFKDILEDFGYRIPASYVDDAVNRAADRAKKFKLGGTRNGKRKKEVKQ